MLANFASIGIAIAPALIGNLLFGKKPVPTDIGPQYDLLG